MASILTFEQIGHSTNRLAMTDMDVEAVLQSLKIGNQKGRDLQIGHPDLCNTTSDFLAAANEGFCFLSSPQQLQTSFLFVKIDAGRSIFGKQKASYMSYISGLTDNEWAVGSVFKYLTLGVTGIGNIYRQEGYR